MLSKSKNLKFDAIHFLNDLIIVLSSIFVYFNFKINIKNFEIV